MRLSHGFRHGAPVDMGALAAAQSGARRRFCLCWSSRRITTTTAMSSNGCARRCRRIRSPRSTVSPRTAPSAGCSATTSTSRSTPSTKPTPRIHPERLAAMIEAAGAGMVDARRRAVEPVSARARLGQAAARTRHPGRHRRLPCFRRAVDAGRRRRRSRPRQGHGPVAVRRRGRRPARTGAARCRRGCAQAAVQLHGRSAGDRGHADPADVRVERAQRTAGGTTCFDAGRGCPYQCSFCTIINVQGRKSRRRSPEDVEPSCARITRKACARSSSPTTISPATRTGRSILDRLIQLREVEKFNTSFIIQVDTLCYKLPNFIEKCRARRRQARVHRAGEHQPGQSARRQEAAEQDHRIPRDAARLEGRRRHHLCRLHPRLPERHRRSRSCTTST